MHLVLRRVRSDMMHRKDVIQYCIGRRGLCRCNIDHWGTSNSEIQRSDEEEGMLLSVIEDAPQGFLKNLSGTPRAKIVAEPT